MRPRKIAFSYKANGQVFIGELLEAMFTLRLVEINRANGNETRARERAGSWME